MKTPARKASGAAEHVLGPDLGDDDQRAEHEQRDVQPGLAVAHERPGLAPHERPVHEREVEAAEDHEHDQHPLRRRREALDRVGLGREAGGRDRRQGVRERLVGRHPVVDPGRPEGEQDREERGGEGDVEHPDAAGGVADARAQRLDLRPRHLVLEQLPAADAQARQDGQREDDDPDPAEPLGELAPDREAAGERLDVRDDAAARGAEAGHPLEEGVDRAVELGIPREDVRERSEGGGGEPCQRDDEEPLADPEAVVAAGGVGDGGGRRLP